jgi:hypothetical protein
MLKSENLLKLGAAEKYKPTENTWYNKFFALDCKFKTLFLKNLIIFIFLDEKKVLSFYDSSEDTKKRGFIEVKNALISNIQTI